MTKQYDLSLVPYEQIADELRRRYPAGVLSFLYQPDGKPPGLEVMSMHWGGIVVANGIADFAHAILVKNMMDGNRQVPHGPLDQQGPIPPPQRPN